MGLGGIIRAGNGAWHTPPAIHIEFIPIYVFYICSQGMDNGNYYLIIMEKFPTNDILIINKPII